MTRRSFDALNAAMLVDKGVLPEPGGWQDQPATFVAAYPYIAREIAHWTDVHRKVAIDEARRKRAR